ncbi:MAG: hypothetical protein HPY83_13400 [Anaerolineae bacterium]|nr:hypothetical protein [Anaerolineae bacterium]
MTPRDRFLAVLRGEMPDRIPFVAFYNKIPRCEVERQLRNQGLCIINKMSVWNESYQDLAEEVLRYRGADGVWREKTTVHTPAGDVCKVDRPAPGTTWHEKLWFSGPQDYEAIEVMIRARAYTPKYRAYDDAVAGDGGDIVERVRLGWSPLQEIIYEIIGVERFAYEWADRRLQVLRLYEALADDFRVRCEVAAESPAASVICDGNVSAEVMGRPRFEEYVLPHWNHCADVMHRRGKHVGAHLDAKQGPLTEAIGRSRLDFIESFTPPPEGDLTLAEARRAWPGKVILMNFPSSLHHWGPQAVEEAAVDIIRQSAPGDRFMLGVFEDVPGDWRQTVPAIARAIERHGRIPIPACLP